MSAYDVVVGRCNAAHGAELAAREQGAERVLRPENATRAPGGGNTHYCGGPLHGNFAAGSGLASGAEFGRVAGANAARHAHGASGQCLAREVLP